MRFSIVVPMYNRASVILPTLESIRKQSCVDFEVILIDDGSTDNTKQIIQAYIDSYMLANWHYFFYENGERGKARNRGIMKACGQWITFLDSDDRFYPEHLETAKQFIDNTQEAQIFHSAYEIKDQSGSLLRSIHYPSSGTLNNSLKNGNLMSCFGVFVRKDLLQELRFNENRALSGSEDWLLWLQFSVRKKIFLQRRITGSMIQHSGRSVMNYNVVSLNSRTNELIKCLMADAVFVSIEGLAAVRKIRAHMLSYTALHLAISKNRSEALKHLMQASRVNLGELFTLRTLAVIKLVIGDPRR